MKKFLFILCLLLCAHSFGGGALAVAQSPDYNPSNPQEPTVIDYCRITVKANYEEGAYASGSGKYKLGTSGSVYISTSARNNEDYTYTFLYWTKNGVKYSTTRYFYYTPEAGNVEFVAHYQKDEVEFDPSNPREPSGSTIKKKSYLYLESNLEGSCTFNRASGEKVEDGTRVYLRVYPSDYFHFDGWKVNGQIISTNTGFYYTMPKENVTITAMFTEIPYDPENPIDPTGPAQGDIDNPQIIRGDVNGDEKVSVADVVSLISYRRGSTPSGFVKKAADADGNGVVTDNDIPAMVNIVLEK